jgi:transposase
MHKNKRILMWYKVKELNRKFLNKSQISKELGIDRATVRSYLSMNESEFLSWVSHPRRMPKKLSRYYKFVKDLLETYEFLSAAQVEDRLKETFKDLPEVSSKTVYNFVHSIRDQHNIKKYNEKTLRQYQKLPEAEYGSEAQVDFGEQNMIDKKGNRRKVYFFAIQLSRSRYKYIHLQNKPFTSASSIYAHEQSFSYFQGIPKKIIYDQDKVFVVEENFGDIRLTSEFKVFVEQHPFDSVFCRKSDPESKGKIENVVGYVKKNFLSGRVYTDIDSLQAEALLWLNRTGNKKIHGTTKKSPISEWEKEKKHLLPYIKTPDTTGLILPEYKVRKDNVILYKGNIYSLPLGTYVNRDSVILLEDTGDTLYFYSREKEKIAEHIKFLGQGEYIRNTDHGRVKSKKLQESEDALLSKFNNTIKAIRFLELFKQDKPRYYHDNLREMLKHIDNYNASIINKVIDFCLENSVFNANEFNQMLSHYRNEESSYFIDYSTDLPKVEYSYIEDKSLIPKTTDISIYEQIF